MLIYRVFTIIGYSHVCLISAIGYKNARRPSVDGFSKTASVDIITASITSNTYTNEYYIYDNFKVYVFLALLHFETS